MTGKQAVYFKTMASIHSLYSVCLFMALQQKKILHEAKRTKKTDCASTSCVDCQ